MSLWIRTDRLDDLYATLKERQLQPARAFRAGEGAAAPDLCFILDPHTEFYGQREFAIWDPRSS